MAKESPGARRGRVGASKKYKCKIQSTQRIYDSGVSTLSHCAHPTQKFVNTTSNLMRQAHDMSTFGGVCFLIFWGFKIFNKINTL